MLYRAWGLLLAAGLAATAAKNPETVTFCREVLPVLQKRCQACHRPNEAAPMSFLSYKETRPWAKAIREAVLLKKMPPWFADPAHGKFSNDRSMTRAEVDTLAAWADSGAREGDPKDAPPPVEFVDGWNIGAPEMVFEMPREFAVPASGTIEYQYLVVPLGFTEDRWVEKAEIRPGNRAVTHHVIAFIRPPDSKWLREAKPGEFYVPPKRDASGRERNDDAGGGPEFLVGFAPGTVPETLEAGRAKLIKAGSDLVFQLHYTANGKPATDRTRLGVIFAKVPPRERVVTLAVQNRKFVIPAGAPNHRVDAELTLQADATLIGMLPHMHLRGKAFEMRAVYTTGESEILLRVPRYSFNWQLSYYLKEPRLLPKGTKIEGTAWFDNSPNNPHNPEPNTEVRWGDQSWEEMMIGFFDVAIDAKINPADLVRKPKPQRSDD